MSYDSYHGLADGREDWHDIDDPGDIFLITSGTFGLPDNGDGKVSEYMGCLDFAEGSYSMVHGMPDFWRYKGEGPGDRKRSSFGFMPVGQEYQYFIEVCPYDMEELPDGYDPKDGQLPLPS